MSHKLPEGYQSPGFVVVTYYQDPAKDEPYVHVYGPYATRAKAKSAVDRDLRRMQERGEDISQVRSWVRTVHDIDQMNRLHREEEKTND